MPDTREVYQMVTQQKSPEPGALQRQQKRQVRSARNKKIGALAIAAVIGIAAVVVVIRLAGDGSGPEPAGQPAPAQPTAEEVATGFVEAFGAFDADRAISYLADDADIQGLAAQVGSGAQSVEGTLGEFRELLSLLEAMNFRQMPSACEDLNSQTSNIIQCKFDFHLFGSDELERGPFTGAWYYVTVQSGEVSSATWNLDVEDDFSAQMWEPFAEWVSATYPEDAAIMYDDRNLTGVALTAESILLWRKHVGDYVEAVEQGTA